MNIFELDLQAIKYFEIVAKIASLEEEKKALQEIFMQAMVEIEQQEIAGHGWKSTWNNTTRKTVDSKALEKAFPEIYNEFLKETHSTRFTLNRVKSN